ncbi:MAG: redoxin domain-containing protein, partial [Verrucomicrobiota bacterium]
DAYPSDSPENMIADAKKYKYPFPYLFDDTQQVAQKYSAACTPDFFLFDSTLKLAYRGQFDDSRPSHRTAPDGPSKGAEPSGTDIRSAIDLLLAGKSVPAEGQKPSLGCNIKWRPGMEPDWFRPYMHG